MFGAHSPRVWLKPVLRVMDGEDDPRVQVILLEGDQHSELILASQFLNHLLRDVNGGCHFPGRAWKKNTHKHTGSECLSDAKRLIRNLW